MPFQNMFCYWENLVPVFLLTFAPFCLLFEAPHYFHSFFFLSYLICMFTFLNGCQNSSGITGCACMLCLISRWKSFFLWFTCQGLSSGDNNFNVLSASFYFIMLPLQLEGSANLTKQQNAKGN